MISKRTLDRIASTIINLSIFGTMLFLMLPAIIAIIESFDPRGFIASFPPPSFSLRWYLFFVGFNSFINGIVTSLKTAVLAIIFALGLGIPASFAIARYEFRGKNFLTNFLSSPTILPIVAFGAAFLSFTNRYGLNNTLLNLSIAHTIVIFPFVLLSILASLKGFDITLEEAAMNLGANPFQTFWKVTLPSIKPGIISAILLGFMMSFGEYSVSMFLTDPRTYTFQIALIGYMKTRYDPAVAVGSVFLLFFSIAATIIIEKKLGIDKFIGVWKPT